MWLKANAGSGLYTQLAFDLLSATYFHSVKEADESRYELISTMKVKVPGEVEKTLPASSQWKSDSDVNVAARAGTLSDGQVCMKFSSHYADSFGTSGVKWKALMGRDLERMLLALDLERRSGELEFHISREFIGVGHILSYVSRTFKATIDDAFIAAAVMQRGHQAASPLMRAIVSQASADDIARVTGLPANPLEIAKNELTLRKHQELMDEAVALKTEDGREEVPYRERLDFQDKLCQFYTDNFGLSGAWLDYYLSKNLIYLHLL